MSRGRAHCPRSGVRGRRHVRGAGERGEEPARVRAHDEAARRAGFDALIVWAIDRFGRSMVGNLTDVLELDRLGVQVVSVRESWLDTGSPVRNLLIAIFSWVAEQERTRLVERTRPASSTIVVLVHVSASPCSSPPRPHPLPSAAGMVGAEDRHKSRRRAEHGAEAPRGRHDHGALVVKRRSCRRLPDRHAHRRRGHPDRDCRRDARLEPLRAMTKNVLRPQRKLRQAVDDDGWKAYPRRRGREPAGGGWRWTCSSDGLSRHGSRSRRDVEPSCRNRSRKWRAPESAPPSPPCRDPV